MNVFETHLKNQYIEKIDPTLKLITLQQIIIEIIEQFYINTEQGIIQGVALLQDRVN